VEISGDFTPSTGFNIVDPGVQEYGGSVKCSTVVDTTTVSPRFSALCAYLNPGDYWQIEVWHLGIMHAASVLARGKGLSYLEHLSPTVEDIRFSCVLLSSKIPKNRISELLPQYCKDRFGF